MVHAARIQDDNDAFRRTCVHTRPRYVGWRGHYMQSEQLLDSILRAIAMCEDFDELAMLNDFGTVVADGRTFHWSIEYLSAESKPVDPSREHVAFRGITIEPD
jgi:hypothetical protein